MDPSAPSAEPSGATNTDFPIVTHPSAFVPSSPNPSAVAEAPDDGCVGSVRPFTAIGPAADTQPESARIVVEMTTARPTALFR